MVQVPRQLAAWVGVNCSDVCRIKCINIFTSFQRDSFMFVLHLNVILYFAQKTIFLGVIFILRNTLNVSALKFCETLEKHWDRVKNKSDKIDSKIHQPREYHTLYHLKNRNSSLNSTINKALQKLYSIYSQYTFKKKEGKNYGGRDTFRARVINFGIKCSHLNALIFKINLVHVQW